MRSLYKKHEQRRCLQCGAEFGTSFRTQKYCGKVCRVAYYNAARRADAPGKRRNASKLVKYVCARCGKQTERRVWPSGNAPKYCSRSCAGKGKTRDLGREPWQSRSTPRSRLSASDLGVLQALWRGCDFSPLESFFGETDLHRVYAKSSNRKLFYEWCVYTILFQAHLTYGYENLLKMPQVRRWDLIRVCLKFGIRFMDSEAFDNDAASFSKGGGERAEQ